MKKGMTYERKCDICWEPPKLDDSAVYAGRFNRAIPALFPEGIERYSIEDPNINESQRRFINQVTRVYFWQQRELMTQGDLADEVKKEVITMRDFAEEERKRFDDQHRLETVLKMNPEEEIYLLMHDRCNLNEAIFTYEIGLDRINTPREYVHWTQHLNEKTSFNPKAWIEFSESLFGRI